VLDFFARISCHLAPYAFTSCIFTRKNATHATLFPELIFHFFRTYQPFLCKFFHLVKIANFKNLNENRNTKRKDWSYGKMKSIMSQLSYRKMYRQKSPKSNVEISS
jgi:lipoprotein